MSAKTDTKKDAKRLEEVITKLVEQSDLPISVKSDVLVEINNKLNIEVAYRRNELQDNIKGLLQEFKNLTGCVVDNLEVWLDENQIGGSYDS